MEIKTSSQSGELRVSVLATDASVQDLGKRHKLEKVRVTGKYCKGCSKRILSPTCLKCSLCELVHFHPNCVNFLDVCPASESGRAY
jgi:hypothetical protein